MESVRVEECSLYDVSRRASHAVGGYAQVEFVNHPNLRRLETRALTLLSRLEKVAGSIIETEWRWGTSEVRKAARNWLATEDHLKRQLDELENGLLIRQVERFVDRKLPQHRGKVASARKRAVETLREHLAFCRMVLDREDDSGVEVVPEPPHTEGPKETVELLDL